MNIDTSLVCPCNIIESFVLLPKLSDCRSLLTLKSWLEERSDILKVIKKQSNIKKERGGHREIEIITSYPQYRKMAKSKLLVKEKEEAEQLRLKESLRILKEKELQAKREQEAKVRNR